MSLLASASLSRKLIISIITFVIIPLSVVSFFSFVLFVKEAEKINTNNFMGMMDIISKNTKTKLDELDDQLLFVYRNKQMVEFNDKSSRFAMTLYEIHQQNLILKNYIESKNNMISVHITSGENDFIYSLDTNLLQKDYLDYEQLFLDTLSKGGGLALLPLYSSERANGTYLNVLPAARTLINVLDNFKAIGTLVVNYDVNFFSSVAEGISFGDKSLILLFDAHNTTIWSNDSSYIGKKSSDMSWSVNLSSLHEKGNQKIAYNGSNNYLFYSNIENYPWKCIVLVPTGNVTGGFHAYRFNFVLGSLVLAVFFISIYFYLQHYIIKPIKKLVVHMQNKTLGEISTEIKVNHQDEIGFLYQSYKTMQNNNAKLLEEVNKTHVEQIQLQSNALKAQMNPHFLYNTLDTINWLVIESGKPEISRLITSFSNILRYSVKIKTKLTTLGDEIKYIKDYCAIQQSMLENKFSIEYCLNNELLQFKTLHFTLQPFIENAIIHGFANKKEGGIIKISITEKEESILITIQDNGSGIPSERLQLINAGIDSGIGINNVNKLIKLTYGNGFGVTIDSIEEMGTAANILIPKIKDVE